MSRTRSVVATAALALSMLPLTGASAFGKHHGFLHRHRNALSAVAGMAAMHHARHSGHGGFMSRHPTLTGIAAAGATHHILKHHTH